MSSSLGFDIFAKDVNASRTFRSVGDEAERTGRKIDSIGSSADGLRSHVSGLSREFEGLRTRSAGAGGALSGLGTALGGLLKPLSGITGNIQALGSQFTRVASSAATAGVDLVVTSAKLSTLAAAAASTASSVGGLVAALAPAGGIIAALPGALGLGVAALGTLKVALGGVSEAFADALSGDLDTFINSEALAKSSAAVRDVAFELFQMAGAFQGTKEAVQNAVFGPLVGQMWSLLPAINAVSDGMVSVAGVFGQAAAAVVDFVRAGETVAAISSLFGSLQQGLTGLLPALRPVLDGFRDLAVVGASFTAGLAPGIADVATRFGEFLSKAAESGRALDWMNGALEVFKQLGAIAKDVSGILSSVFGALKASGAGPLGVIGQTLAELNRGLATSAGQSMLIDIFTALHRIGQALAPILGAVVNGIAALAPKVADVAQAFAPLVTEIINALVPALKAILPGVVAVGDALVGAFARADVRNAILDLGRGIGDVFTALAPLAAQIVSTLAPALASLMPGLLSVSQALGEAFAKPAVRDAVVGLAQGIANLAIALTPLIGPLVQIATIIVERWAAGLQLLATFLTPVVSALADVLTPILPQVAELFGQVSDALKPLIDQFGNDFGNALRDVGVWLTPVMDALKEVTSEILTHLAEVLPQVTPAIGDIARAFADVFKELVKIMPDLIRFSGDIVVQLIDQLPNMVPYIKDMAIAFADIAKQVAPMVPDLLKLANDFVKEIIPELPSLLKMLVDLAHTLEDIVKQVTPLLDKFDKAPEAMAGIKIFAGGVILALDTIKAAFGFVLGVVETFIGTFFGFPELAQDGISRMLESLKGWVNGIIGFIERAINALADTVPGGIVPHISIPRFAEGIIVDRPTLGVFGEAGPEAVIPLSNPRRARELAYASGLAGILGQTASVGATIRAAVAAVSAAPAVASGPAVVNVSYSFSFNGQPLHSDHEIRGFLVDAINAAANQGFNMGVIAS